MKRIEYDMYRSLAVWGRRVIKTENAVSRMKRVVKGYHWLNEGYYVHTKNKDWVRRMLNKL